MRRIADCLWLSVIVLLWRATAFRVRLATTRGARVLLRWLQDRRRAARLAEADADALVTAKGEHALEEAHRQERMRLVRGPRDGDPRTAEHWRKVAQIIVIRAAREQGAGWG